MRPKKPMHSTQILRLSFFYVLLLVMPTLFSGNALASGSISGQVSYPGTGETISISFSNGMSSQSVIANADGTYLKSGLPAGMWWRVRAYPLGDTFLYAQYYDGQVEPNDADYVEVVDGEVTQNINFTLVTGGKVSGRILESGVPRERMAMGFQYNKCANYGTENGLGYGFTDADGYYTKNQLPAGTYYVKSSSGGVKKWWSASNPEGTTDCDAADTITVVAGEITTNIDISFYAGSVSGRVVDAAGAPLPSIGVSIYSNQCESLPYLTNYSDANGEFSLNGIGPGDYYIKGSGGVIKWWQQANSEGIANCSQADPITVSAGADVIISDFTLLPTGGISGRVTDSNDQPLYLQVQADIFTNPCNPNSLVGSAARDESGNFYRNHMPIGTYYVHMGTWGPHVGEWWNGSAQGVPAILCEDAAPVVVTAGETTNNIDFILETGASVSGSVIFAGNPASSPVQLFFNSKRCSNGQSFGVTTADYSTGGFTKEGLPAGDVFIEARPFGDDNAPWIYWDGVSGDLNCNNAVAVPIAEGASISGIVFDLIEGGYISGHVQDGSGSPVVHASVSSVTALCAGNSKTTVNTDDNGNYLLEKLPADSNYVVITHPDYNGQWWNNTSGGGACGEAVPVQVVGGQTTADIDFTLFSSTANTYTVGGVISGLTDGNSLTLQNNGGDDLPVGVNGAFTFASAVADGSSYTVTVLTQPSLPSQTCNIFNGTGTLSGTDISNIQVICNSPFSPIFLFLPAIINGSRQ